MRSCFLAIALMACRGDASTTGASAPGAGTTTDAAAPAIDPAWSGACLDALDRAAAAPPGQRIELALAGCRPCGVDWRDVTATRVPPPSRVVAVVDACALACPNTARSDFFAAISGLEDDQRASGAWRALGKRCAAALGDGGGDGRYASGTWFALHQIGRRLADAALPERDRSRWRALRDRLWLPLPVLSQIGTGFALPTAGAVVEPATTHVTITGDAIAIGALPRAIFDEHGLALAPDAGAAWPGEPIALEALAAALDARAAREVVLIVPMGLVASRVLTIVAQLGDRRAMIAVDRPSGAPAATATAFTRSAAPRMLAIDAGASRACATRGTATVTCVDLPTDRAARLGLLAELTAGHPRVAISVMPPAIPAPTPGRRTAPPPPVDADAIVARLDELAGLGVTEVSATEARGPWPTTTAAAVRAALAEGASP